MSNESLSSQNMDVDSSHNSVLSNSSADAATSDPASSLRAAALLTLKLNKRRKPAGDHSMSSGLPIRPIIVDNSIQLDYGQEDVFSSVPEESALQSQLSKSPMDMEDGQIREEGEISDSEDMSEVTTKATNQPKLVTPPPSTGFPGRSSQTGTLEAHSVRLRQTPPRSAMSLKIESPSHNLLGRMTDLSAGSPGLNGHSKTLETPMADHSIYFVDSDHVRPGLELNQAQYDAVKDIVLDLLGWGVPPGYLLECGLSREIVFYVFSELNLRLPDNLDVSGLVPYLPSTAPALIRGQLPAEVTSQRPNGRSSLPSKSVAPGQDLRSPGVEQRSAASIPSPPPLTTPTSSGTSTASSSNANTALHDMERQRRQELLARKAVQASRRRGARSTSPSTLPAASDDVDAEMTSLVPSETVDDFLKSIGPVSADDNEKTPSNAGNEMDVDDIPGLRMPSPRSPVASTPVASGSQYQVGNSDSAMNSPPQTTVSVQGIAPNSGVSNPSALDQASRRSSSSEEVTSQNGFSRKNGKRPVAADFVDFDVTPRNRDHRSTHNAAQPQLLKRRSGGSFAGISTMRRCVIDLSDSEDEADSAREVGAWHIQSSPKAVRTSAPVSAGNGSYSTSYSSLSGGSVLSHRTMSPAALAEKELEIQKMRQMIAEREMGRFKKFKKLDAKPSTDDGLLPDVSIAIKQEEEESGMSLSTTIKSSTSASTPDIEPPLDSTGADSIPKDADADASTTPSIGNIIRSESNLNSVTLTAQDQAPIADSVKVVTSPSIAPIMEPQGFITEGLVDVDTASSSSAQANLKTSQHHRRPEGNLDQLQEMHSLYQTYVSLFDSYPQLRSRPRPIIRQGLASKSTKQPNFPSPDTSNLLASSSFPHPIPSTTSSIPSFHKFSSSVHSQLTVSSLPNLRPLRLTTISRLLPPSKRVCQYEVPGWGVCRDNGCEDVHLSRPAAGDPSGVPLPMTQPNDQDVAMFLSAALPEHWVSAYGNSFGARIISLLEDIRLKNPTMDLEERAARALAVFEMLPPAT